MIMSNNQINHISIDLATTLRSYPISMALAIIIVPFFIFVTLMLIFHTFLIMKNLTTK